MNGQENHHHGCRSGSYFPPLPLSPAFGTKHRELAAFLFDMAIGVAAGSAVGAVFGWLLLEWATWGLFQ